MQQVTVLAAGLAKCPTDSIIVRDRVPELHGGISRTHRIAIHRRHRQRRLRPPRGDVAREDAMMGGIKGHHFFGQRFSAGWGAS